jgi:hypothetical protein
MKDARRKGTENDREKRVVRPNVAELLGRYRWSPRVDRDIAL